jgi:hypothetical protein
MTTFAAGEQWRYRAGEAGLEASRLIIGAVLTFPASPSLVCCAVTAANRRAADGTLEPATIPFLPMTQAAVAASVTVRDGEAALPDAFQRLFEAWRQDPRGLTYFTVPFEGRLDHMIARQMAEMIGANAQSA